MKVKFLGFGLSIDNFKLPLDDYFNFLMSNTGNPQKFGDYDRYFYLNTTHSQDYFLGLIVTAKNQKKFCELLDKDGNFSIRVNKLDPNANLMDFNFFVINKKSGFGLYQHYYHSCSTNTLASYFIKNYSEFRKKLNKEKAKYKLKNGRTKVNFQMLVRDESLSDLISSLKEIKSFEYSFASITIDEDEFKPLSGYVKKKNTKISFLKDSPTSFLAERLTNIVQGSNLEKGKISGVSQDNIDMIINIEKNLEDFGLYDYDVIANELDSLDINKFEESWVISELLDKCKEHEHIFEVEVI